MEPIVWLLPLTDGAGGDFNEVVSWPEDQAGFRDVVVEHNTIKNSQVGIRMDDGCVGVLLRKNAFHQIEYELLDTPRLRRMLTVERAKLVGGKNPAYYLSFDRKNGRLFPDDSGNNLQAMETVAGALYRDAQKMVAHPMSWRFMEATSNSTPLIPRAIGPITRFLPGRT